MNLLHQFFESTASKYPELIAVKDHGEKISYKSLESYSNRLANFINKLKAQSKMRIVIFTEKNFNQYISLLASLKSGNCWVPIQVNQPKDRLKVLFATINPHLVITEKDFDNKLSFFKGPIINLCKKDVKTKLSKFSNKRIKVDINPEDLAYIIFTSGSTGVPKAVTVSHQNSFFFLDEMKNQFTLKKKLNFAHFSELTFDPSIFDIFVCWMSGGTLIPFNKNSYKINPLLFFQSFSINIILCVPSLFNTIKLIDSKFESSCFKKIKYLIFTGEKINKELVKDWYKSNEQSKVINFYGTTETAIISHLYEIPRNFNFRNDIPIGRKLKNVSVVLIDEKNKINEKLGVSHVYGPQISRGYWDNDYQNKLYFIDHPQIKHNFFKLYNTGDILEKKNNGLYYFKGRRDSQIKFNGVRIELGEIENTLNNLPQIDDVVVKYFNDKKKKEIIIAFIKSNNLLKDQITNYLEKSLPRIMQPSAIRMIEDDFPRNINGKIDRKKLTKNYGN
ncbi:MAG: AMP-binding protein [Alphaproteobacteria bacterium]